jgi:hypothetical protein
MVNYCSRKETNRRDIMRKADLKKNHKYLDESIERYRGFMEKILNAQRVISTKQEKQDVAESIILRLSAVWEYFVEDHLIDCINCDPSKLEDFFGVPIPNNPSRAMCQVLLLGNSFKSFRDFSELKGFSKKILPDESNPFLAVTKKRFRYIDEVHTIRNYLSHYSLMAKRKLKKLYMEEYGYSRFLEPGQVMLGNKADLLWKYFDAFQGASEDMKKWY